MTKLLIVFIVSVVLWVLVSILTGYSPTITIDVNSFLVASMFVAVLARVTA